nr:hypothetical protein [Lachnospiraceae bacterium]
AQQAQAASLSDLASRMIGLSAGFSADQKAYYTNLLNDVELETSAVSESVSGNKSIVKLAIPVIKKALIGLIIGIVLFTGYICCSYIFGKLLRTPSEMESTYRCYVISTVKGKKEEKKGFLSSFDNFIEKKYDAYFGLLPREEAMKIACEEISFALKKGDKHKLFITGTCGDSDVDELKDALIKGIKSGTEDNTAEIKAGGSVISDASSLKEMLASDAVVFVEKADSSLHKDISREMLICRKNGMNIIGSVIFMP